MRAVPRCSSLARVEQDQSDGRPYIRVLGELDISNRDLLSRLPETTPDGPPVVVVDLAGVSFLDSTAVIALIQAAEGFRRRKQELLVTAPPDHMVRRIVSILGIEAELVVTSEGQQDTLS